MEDLRKYQNPEPVPDASQLAILPFLSGVEGYLRGKSDGSTLRVTLHRIMQWEAGAYFQQLCSYLGTVRYEPRSVGRLFNVSTGIIGATFEKRRILRTRGYGPSNKDKFMSDLKHDMESTGDTRPINNVALSYIAIPFLGPEEQVVLVLYADSFEYDFFAKNEIANSVRSMCDGFCRLLDLLQDNPFPNLRNFPLQKGDPIKGRATVYGTVQEELDLQPPRLQKLTSFNYEASIS